MKVDITELLIVFKELLEPPTNEELGVYYFGETRADSLTVTLSFSIYENYANISIYNSLDAGIANVRMKNCSEIRVLDLQKKCLEIVHENSQGRCFIALLGDSIIKYDE